MKTYLISFTAAMALLFASCGSTEVASSADVNQDKIHQHYTVRIDREYGSAEAEAQFRFGGSLGTTLDLAAPANITCNGDDMFGEKEFLQGHVYSQKIDPSIPDYTFVYTDFDETVFTNSVRIEAISLGEIPDQINITEVNEMMWNGAPVGNNETVTVHLSGQESSASFSTSTMGATSVKVDPSQLTTLKNGPTTIYIVRSVDKACDESADEGGTIAASYSSEHKSVTITGAMEVIQ